jgi:hypothetical protein
MMIIEAPTDGAFLGRLDVQQLLIARLQDRNRGPLPMPRFSELCDGVATQLTLGDDITLGWPPALVELIDTVCCAQNDQTAFAFLNTATRTTPPGACLQAVPLQFLRHLINDPDFGAHRYCDRELSAHLSSLDALIARRLNAAPGNTESWPGSDRTALNELTRTGRSASTLQHYVALLIRSIAELNAARAARWSWQAAAEAASSHPIAAAESARRWQLGILCSLIARDRIVD